MSRWAMARLVNSGWETVRGLRQAGQRPAPSQAVRQSRQSAAGSMGGSIAEHRGGREGQEARGRKRGGLELEAPGNLLIANRISGLTNPVAS